MAAEDDIAALEDGGRNTAAEVRTALTSVLKAVYRSEPGLKPPSSPHADDDEFLQANGANPTSYGWSWGNQTGVTAEYRGGRLIFDGVSSSSRSYHCLLKAFPASGDVTISTRATLFASNSNWAVGLVFLWGTLATPTHLEIVYLIQEQTSGRQVFWTYGSNYTTGTANRGNDVLDKLGNPPYLRMTWNDSLTQLRGWAATSPLTDSDWVPLAAAATAPGSVAPDYYGLNLTDLSNSPSGATLSGHLDFFRVNWTPDFDPTT